MYRGDWASEADREEVYVKARAVATQHNAQ